MIPETANRIVISIATFLSGALFNHLWNRYRGRLVPIRWSVYYHKVAVAGEDPRLGRVAVLHDDKPVRNVHTVAIQLENEGNADLKDIVVQFAFVEGSKVLRSFGSIEGSLDYAPYADDFLKAVGSARPQDLDSLLWRVIHRIPVFNRRARANFYLLVSRHDDSQPVVTVACDHVGIQLKQRPPGPVLFGVNLNQATLAGLIATLVMMLGILWCSRSAWVVGPAAWLLGLSSLLVGVGILRLWRGIARLLS